MTKLRIVVQHHPDRKRHLSYLLHGLQLTHRDNYVVSENDGGTWNACQQALDKFGEGDTHILVLQDDVLPCRDLVKAAERIAEIAGDQPITLFTNNPRATGAVATGYTFLQMNVWFMAQAYILSREFVANFLEWDKLHAIGGRMADDEHLALYCFCNKIPVLATVPSLVEHLGWRTTTIDERRPNKRYLDVSRRVASTFHGFENSALDIDWAVGFKNPQIDRAPGKWDIFGKWYKD